MHPDINEILVTEEKLKDICKELGAKITNDYKGKKLLVVSILKGSVIFMADILREIDLPCVIDFMAISSYGAGSKSSGAVKIVKDLSVDPEGYDVLIVEDILDSGRTLKYVCNMLKSRNINSVAVCTLMDKPSRRVTDLKADYAGLEVPDEFVVGYGLDYAEKYRNLPYIGILKREIYENED